MLALIQRRCINMPEYRAYILSHDGRIQSFEPLVCADDVGAIAKAKQFVDGHDVELWQGARKVAALPHKPLTKP